MTAAGQGAAAWGDRHASARRLVFWRHGRTTWNAEQRFQGQTDIPLDDTGLAQAARAAKVLARLKPSLIVSSDLSRARATAQQLADLTEVAFADSLMTRAGGLRARATSDDCTCRRTEQSEHSKFAN